MTVHPGIGVGRSEVEILADHGQRLLRVEASQNGAEVVRVIVALHLLDLTSSRRHVNAVVHGHILDSGL